MPDNDGQETSNEPIVVNDVAPPPSISSDSDTPKPVVEPTPAMQEVKPTQAVEPAAEPVAPEPAAAVVSAPSVAAQSAPSKAKYLHFAAEVVLLVAVVILGSQLASAKTDNKNLQTQLAGIQSNPQALVQKQSDDLIAKVGALMKLPAGETPTVAAVSDAAAAKQQSPFFANAANGDKVLLYVKAGEAILYRPSTNKIILVAPLTFNNAQASATTKK